MIQYYLYRRIGFYVLLLMNIHLCKCKPTVEMHVDITGDQMTLICRIYRKHPEFKIFLSCPLAKKGLYCSEDCTILCQNCPSFTCGGQSESASVTEIKYTIDITNQANTGNWKCVNQGVKSSAIYVNATSPKKTPVPLDSLTIPSNSTTKNIKSTTKVPLQKDTSKQEYPVQKSTKSYSDVIDLDVPYEKLITKSEFIMTVIGLLTLSIIFNIFFCCRMIIIHCQSKKSQRNSQYFPVNAHNPHYTHSQSHASDSERIYEDTSLNNHHIPYLTQIKNGNGNYLASSTLSPNSANSTMLKEIPCNHSIQMSNSPTDNTSRNIIYPFLSDNSQATYATITVPPGNNYTKFVSVQPELSRRDSGNLPQPVYLSFPTGNPMPLTGSRYVQYDSQPVQSTSPISQETRPTSRTPETVSSAIPHSKNTFMSNSSSEGKSNYQLSREMMEEADNLLRTADTLLRSTGLDVKFYQH